MRARQAGAQHIGGGSQENFILFCICSLHLGLCLACYSSSTVRTRNLPLHVSRVRLYLVVKVVALPQAVIVITNHLYLYSSTTKEVDAYG